LTGNPAGKLGWFALPLRSAPGAAVTGDGADTAAWTVATAGIAGNSDGAVSGRDDGSWSGDEPLATTAASGTCTSSGTCAAA
jgi:hypothetical protein